ncbi:MAG TPA: alpha/beta fold hydrolase [Candidatus Bathyarchaeia archaeon]|nr:alpha/beta fold hydrolase [Candidatus Bathyarchaeia archaeon]
MKLAHIVVEPPGDGPHPTIIALHGFGSTALELLGQLEPLIRRERFLWIAPEAEAPVATEGGAASAGRGWFPFTPANRPTSQSIAQAVAGAREFVEEACLRYPIDRSRLVLLGFSQGGVIAYALALSDPSRYRALVALSSWLSNDLLRALPDADRRRFPVWVQHGTRDEVIMVSRGRDSAARLRELGVELRYREYDAAHEVVAPSLAELADWLEGLLLGDP